MPDFDTIPDILDHPEVLKACQHIANMVGEYCTVPSTLLMRQNHNSMEVIVSSDHPDTPYKPLETVKLNSGLYCEKVISSQFPLHVPNATIDPNWENNPDIKLGMISYYGVPINWPDGSTFGTFCILDRKEHPCLPQEQHMVQEFAQVIETLLEQVVAKETLRHMANHDDLTGVLNRAAMLRRLDEEVERAQRYKTPLALIYLDLDHFKKVNDRYGHLAGDLVLQHFAALLEKECRLSDLIGRMGGEEFLIGVPQTSIKEASLLAQRILTATENTPIVAENIPLRVTVSAGVVSLSPDEINVSQFVNRADDAMYLAKQAGRNQVISQ